MSGAYAVYYREMLLMRQRAGRLVASMAVSPLLYLVTFGHGLGRGMSVDGVSYALFLLPGLIAMGSMMQSYAMSSEINIARFYYHIFEEIQASPVGPAAYVLGEVMAGLTKGLVCAAVVAGLGLAFGIYGHLGPLFWLAVALNAFFFSSLAVCVAMLVRSHKDQALLTNFVITPMAFLGGTFFPVSSLPAWAGFLVELLPLPHAARAIRQAYLGQEVQFFGLAVVLVMGCAAFVLAVILTRRAVD